MLQNLVQNCRMARKFPRWRWNLMTTRRSDARAFGVVMSLPLWCAFLRAIAESK
jgi:hypothetical protein